MNKKQQIIQYLITDLLNNDRANNEESPSTKPLFQTGEKYFIRTVTYHTVGVCVDVVDGFVVLKNAMWVADSGKFANALKEGFEKQSNSELEPFPSFVYINISSIVDFVIYEPEIVLIQK
jgi:hypothetical protein